LDFLEWLLRGSFLYRDVPDFRKLCGIGFCLRVIHTADRQFHVRLARADPDFANKDVRELDFVFAFDCKLRRRAARFKRFECHLPRAVLAGSGFLGLVSEFDGDIFTRIRRAPNGHWFIALKNEVIAEKRGQFDVRVRSARQSGEKQDNSFHGLCW